MFILWAVAKMCVLYYELLCTSKVSSLHYDILLQGWFRIHLIDWSVIIMSKSTCDNDFQFSVLKIEFETGRLDNDVHHDSTWVLIINKIIDHHN